MRHIAITGLQASGKTTLARRLSAASGIPVIAIDDFAGDWQQFRYHAHTHPGLLLIESVALPAWPLWLLIYCRCDEHVRQRRLRARPVEHNHFGVGHYDHSRVADLVLDTTGHVDLAPILNRISGAADDRPARPARPVRRAGPAVGTGRRALGS